MKEIKEIKEEYYKAQKSLYSGIQQTDFFFFFFFFFCIDECTCKEVNILSTFNNSIERDLFLKVRDRIYRTRNKIYNYFNSLCNEFMSSVCINEINGLSK